MKNRANIFFRIGILLFIQIAAVQFATAQDIYTDNEYINDSFNGWTAAGTAGSSNIWASGSQTIKCVDNVVRTISYVNCVINPTDNVSVGDCPLGSVLIRNSNYG